MKPGFKMKQILFVFGLVLMFGCCGSNIPTQYITEGVILLPDYTVQVSENVKWCCLDTLVQTPGPGTFISPKPCGVVTIMSYDCYGNNKLIEFDVVTLKTAR
jgi:hypothetical protein